MDNKNTLIELEETIYELRQCSDNLFLCRQGIVNGECFDNTLIDNGLFMVENRLDAIHNKLFALLEQIK